MSESTPPDLELLRSFVNTNEPDTQTDQLDTPERLHSWLVDRSLLAAEATIDAKGHREVLEFREAIRALALSNGTAKLGTGVLDTLNRVGAEASLSVLLRVDGHAELRATGQDLHQAFGYLLSIIYTATIDGSFRRLKGCANDTCQWLFYDRSKNRSKKWCEMQTCGNAINARAYRQRRRHEPDTPRPEDTH